MFCVRRGQIYEIEIVKPSRRGTAFWCRYKTGSKYYIISSFKLFDTFEEAIKNNK